MSVREQLAQAFERVAQRLLPEEGRPPVPPRLREEVELWFARNPRATPAEVLDFAVAHAEEAHAAGFLRGIRWATLQAAGASQAELEAEHRRHTFSLAASRPVAGPQEAPGEPWERMPDDGAMAEAFDVCGATWGTHRVVLLDP